MSATNVVKVRRALVSVSDKTGVVEFCRGLVAAGVEILSTGGTANALRDADIPVRDVSEETGFPEILSGRVKTLHPKIHGAILAMRSNPEHRRAIEAHGIRPIDLVAVNLYPFRDTIHKPNVAFEDAIENIDIGGPCLIRAAAKNFADVAVVVRPRDYAGVLAEIRDAGGVSLATRRTLATRAFQTTAGYDAAIRAWLAAQEGDAGLPEVWVEAYERVAELRYGENPHQRAALYLADDPPGPCAAHARKLAGKDLSFTNLLDLEAAFELVKEFESPAACVIKHRIPCGAAAAETLPAALEGALHGDPISAFGGILGFNRALDVETAHLVVRKGQFFECVIAPEVTPEALGVLRDREGWGEALRVMAAGLPDGRRAEDRDVRGMVGGLLVQDRDRTLLEEKATRVVSRRQPTEAEWQSLRFAIAVAKHTTSNAIAVAKGRELLGIGSGQTSRIEAVRIALAKAGERARGAALASDAFFPFRDSVDEAARAGITAIVQPGGSKKDEEVVQAANEHGIALVFSGFRHFRH
ncbi:MAG: bifunctional phosphoribosylaminoimidazolecarboxamide formyltransferase/IMP cyclohydrolase [Planctomycetes bacterium]|nr:bifunctional phosphoribosylaminoimidazolecarboxamide formyltransferase/IMP cyclohydrolase [Planctomycetota bacterium]MBI3848310.1 bifunctional phosphoribosylaminoimidazolecarboxamide formyltransferase/IMP cyclohydrolase [Planctomycetota bacterium]